MVINGTDFMNDSWGTTFKAFTDLLDTGFYLVPITFIAIALYIKTRNPVLVSAFMLGSCLLLSGGSIFKNNPEMAIVYGIFAAIGIVGLVLGLFFMRK